MHTKPGNPLEPDAVAALAEITATEPGLSRTHPSVTRQAGSLEFLRKLPPYANTTGHRPPTLPFRPRPKRLQVRDEPEPGLHFSSRYAFFDLSYPWSAFGRVTSGRFGDGGIYAASGVMVGPRHMLTSSRIVGWHASGPTDWLMFKPLYSNGATPFGTAFAETIFSWRQLDYLTTDNRTDLLANDYVVAVLDTRIGESTGWLGSRVYDPSWNNLSCWDFVGYASDVGSGQMPVYQNGVPITGYTVPAGSNPPPNALLMSYQAWMGIFPELESGGPFFGWWTGDVGPRVVAVDTVYETVFPVTSPPAYSSEFACGGSPLVSLIQQARAEFP